MRLPQSPLLALGSVLFFQGCTPDEPPEPTLHEIEAEVRARSQAVVAAEEAFDWETAVTFSAPEVIVQPANAPQYQGREAQLDAYRTSPAMLDFEGTTTEITPADSGGMVYEAGVNRFVLDTPAGPVPDSGKYFRVWKKIEGEWYVTALYFSSYSVPTTNLDTDRGQVLLRRNTTPDFEPLTRNWVRQSQMFCGPASAVTVMNSLQPEAGYTQDSLFVDETLQILTPDEVRRGQATLQSLAALIRVRSGLSVAANHAGNGPGESDLVAFRQQVKENTANSDDYMIVNYSLLYLNGMGEGGGHASPLAAYDEEEDLVLILDVRSQENWAWIPIASLYEAMNTIDEVSGKHRGWLTVTK